MVMTRKDHGFFVKRQYFNPDGLNQAREVSTRQIRPSGLSHKDGIPRKKMVLAQQTDRAGRMSGGMDNGQFTRTEGYGIAIIHPDICRIGRRQTNGLFRFCPYFRIFKKSSSALCRQ